MVHLASHRSLAQTDVSISRQPSSGGEGKDDKGRGNDCLALLRTDDLSTWTGQFGQLLALEGDPQSSRDFGHYGSNTDQGRAGGQWSGRQESLKPA